MGETNDDARDLIISLRGGLPDRCDFCGELVPPEQLEPEEAGDWVCHDCLNRWREEGTLGY